MDQIFNKLIQSDTQFMYFIMNLNIQSTCASLSQRPHRYPNVFGQQPPPFQNNCYIIKENIFLKSYS